MNSNDASMMGRPSELHRLQAERDTLRRQLADANRGAERNAHINRSLAEQLVEVRKQLAARDEALGPFAAVADEFTPYTPDDDNLACAAKHFRHARAVRAVRLARTVLGFSLPDAIRFVDSLHTPIPVDAYEEPKVVCRKCRITFDKDDQRLIAGLCPVCGEAGTIEPKQKGTQ